MTGKRGTAEIITEPGSGDLLGLPGLVIKSSCFETVTKNKKIIHTHILKGSYVSDEAPICHMCNRKEKMHCHGKGKPIRIKDIPHGMAHIVLEVSRDRFLCPTCERTKTASLPWMRDEHRITTRLYDQIRFLALEHGSSQASHMTGLDERTVRNIVSKFIDELDGYIPLEAPEVVGADEVHGGTLKSALLNITNAKDREILELSEEGRSKGHVIDQFMRMQNRDRTKHGVSDMNGSYHDAMKQCFPITETIADKRHVLEWGRKAMASVRDQTRKKIGKRRSAELYGDRGILNKRRHQLSADEEKKIAFWTNKYPRLGKSYELKEAYYDLFNCKTSDEVLEAFLDWSESIPENLEKEFGRARRYFANNLDKILEYFNAGKCITNAYTEAANGQVKLLRWNMRGSSFSILRARALYRHGRWNQAAIHYHHPDFKKKRNI